MAESSAPIVGISSKVARCFVRFWQRLTDPVAY
jgi:hypothetical protein